jgi:hypothetical protein
MVRALGENISLRLDDGSVAVGFYTTRSVSAKNDAHAIETAKEVILSEWHAGDLAKSNSGGMPSLTIEKVWQLGFFQRIIGSPKGYTFFRRE